MTVAELWFLCCENGEGIKFYDAVARAWPGYQFNIKFIKKGK